MSIPAKPFWSRVAISGPNECWPWLAAKSPAGYGRVRWGGRTVRAPRVAYELTGGAIPDGMYILHHCDNPPCVNPAHLYCGTMADNGRDKVVRGRSASGEKNGMRKLSVEQVRSIRGYKLLGMKHGQIAKMFGVDRHTLYDAEHGKTWRNL